MDKKKLKKKNKNLEKRVKFLEKCLKDQTKSILYFKMPLSSYGDLIFDLDETEVFRQSVIDIVGDRFDVITGWSDVEILE